ncbi:hypothetical protein W97_08248 [Coniosporium apollinis CBS 100218]|uniref:Regulatory P domain-containing protein n=1 Tax=Coniosporium apollinis (strain CBS 100218) TaxID=1168221 RepID=R7Z480_CONA1|nr:uncharacterized protein W97_08248 [Coniosporium apollinis CBS 100218]EON68990.1 hypothetical protein W97_08248 [Coniosporium apollinis CBS 100218]
MRFSTLALLGLVGTAFASEMDLLMEMKTAEREAMRSRGDFAKGKHARREKEKCKDGRAGEYACDNVDMLDFISHEEMGSTTREGNDVWGWTSPNGREFGAVGQTDGTAFVEVRPNGELTYLGRLPTQTVPSLWRDMKVIDGYCYIGSEAPGHGLQVFDMRKLLSIKLNGNDASGPVTFNIATDLTAWFRGFGSSHNIVAHEEAKMIYAVGTGRRTPCQGGLFMVDVSDPANPTSPGCANQDGYVHDAQCVFYNGPDGKYNGREICFAYNEDTLTIMDVSDKKAPVVISRTPYVGAAYTHQGWLVDENDMSFLLLDDELDEMRGTGAAANGRTTTYIFNITNLAAPINTGLYQSPVKAIDHNQYVIDGLSYQSNYGSGLRIVDVRAVEADPSGKSFKQVGFFDVHPEDDAVGGSVAFVGTWSNYPYFKSGHIIVNSIERGLYSLKYTGKK